MKAQKISYAIATPCHEDWNQMSAEKQGKFCEVCSKSVVDFSKMTDQGIVAYMEAHKSEKVCGRFASDQLGKSYDLPLPSRFNFDLRAVVLGVALTTFLFEPAHAQGMVVKNEKVVEDTTVHEKMLLGDVAVSYSHAEPFAAGIIKLAGKNSMSQVKIDLLDEQGKVLATVKPNEDGTFKVDLDWKLNPYSLRFYGPSIRESQHIFSYYPSIDKLTITLYEERIMVKGNVREE